MKPYRALWTAPLTARNGNVSYEDGHAIKWHDITRWPAHGVIYAKSAEQAHRLAKDEYGGSPVIEEIQEPIHYVAS